ncbi:MAG: DUF4386 domain-containing protein [Candidatus Hodarchaeales archaeon]|jgi:hypothetical protein
MNSDKINARIAGVLFITAIVAGILSGVIMGGILEASDVLAQVSANENQFIIGALFYFIMAVACASIAIPMYPTLKKHNEALALGAVGFRIIEGVIWMVGVISLLLLVTLSQEFVQAGSPNDPYFQTLSKLLLAGADMAGALVLGGFAFGLGALMYNYVFFQSKLVPRWLSVWGLIAATLVLTLNLFDMFGVFSEITILLNLPTFVGEMVLAVWLIVKGFNSSGE